MLDVESHKSVYDIYKFTYHDTIRLTRHEPLPGDLLEAGFWS